MPVPVSRPGIIVQVPLEGNPFSTTLPVGTVHEEGCVVAPKIGAGGADGAPLITTSADCGDMHPASLLTVKLYVPGLRFIITVLVPLPVTDPGLIVQVPVEGRPFSTTLPSGDEQEVGFVIVPTIGAVGAEGALLIITACDSADMHPASLVTLK